MTGCGVICCWDLVWVIVTGVFITLSYVVVKRGRMSSAANVTRLPFCAIFGQMTVLQAGKTESFVQSKIPSFTDRPFQEFRTCIEVVRLLAGEAELDDDSRFSVDQISTLSFFARICRKCSGTLWSPSGRFCSPISLE